MYKPSKINYLSNGEMPMVTRHQGAEHSGGAFYTHLDTQGGLASGARPVPGGHAPGTIPHLYKL